MSPEKDIVAFGGKDIVAVLSCTGPWSQWLHKAHSCWSESTTVCSNISACHGTALEGARATGKPTPSSLQGSSYCPGWTPGRYGSHSTLCAATSFWTSRHRTTCLTMPSKMLTMTVSSHCWGHHWNLLLPRTNTGTKQWVFQVVHDVLGYGCFWGPSKNLIHLLNLFCVQCHVQGLTNGCDR